MGIIHTQQSKLNTTQSTYAEHEYEKSLSTYHHFPSLGAKTYLNDYKKYKNLTTSMINSELQILVILIFELLQPCLQSSIIVSSFFI